jgi:hypothetical protein
MVMSRKGNDLVRKYLWLAASTACQHNPAVRALYHRLAARGTQGGRAIGHCMRKLLHLVFAVWQTGKPFNPDHYPWEKPRGAAKEVAAGHSQGTSPAEKVVTAAPVTVSAAAAPVKEPTAAPIDFAELRRQVSMEQVLSHVGILGELRGSGAQRRGRCPIHAAADDRRRTFSVNLKKNVFQCFDPECNAHGNVLDFYAAWSRLPLLEAAQQLAATFTLTIAPDTEKRNP